MTEPVVRLQGVSKRFADVTAVDDVSLDILDGEFLTLLGPSGSGKTTARLVTFPLLRSALVAGAVLAFGLSFDEIVVTTFTAGPGIQTLPQWVFNNLFRPNQGPIVNAVAAALLLVSVAPIWVANRLSSDPASASGRL